MHLRVGLIDDRVIPHRFSSRPSMTQSVRTSARERLTRRRRGPRAARRRQAHRAEIDAIAKKLLDVGFSNHVDGATGHYLLGIGGVPDLTTKRFETRIDVVFDRPLRERHLVAERTDRA